MDYLLVYTWHHLPTGQRGESCAYFYSEYGANEMFSRWNQPQWEYTKDIYHSGRVTAPKGIEFYPKVYPWPNHHFAVSGCTVRT